MLEQQILKCRPNIRLVTRNLRTVHRSVGHGYNPGRLLPIDTLKVLLQPLVLRVRFGIGVVAHWAERTAVRDVRLRFGRVRFVALKITSEGPRRTFREIRLA